MEGALTTAPARRERPAALDASTMCEAFQITAAERPGDAALRTIRDGISITWAEYSERVQRLAGAFSTLGVGHGHTVGFMLTNRPEFHLLDTGHFALEDQGAQIATYMRAFLARNVHVRGVGSDASRPEHAHQATR